MRWARNVACVGRRNSAYRVMVLIYKQKRLLARPRRGWGDNMKIYIKRNYMGRLGLDSSGCGNSIQCGQVLPEELFASRGLCSMEFVSE
jgi:hypothetical protein